MRSLLRPSAALLVCSLLLPVASAGAQSAPGVRINQQNNTPVLEDFVIAPPRTLLSLRPGETKTIELQIHNRFGKPATFSLSTEDFDIDPAENTPRFFASQRSGPFPAREWIRPEADRVALLHGDRAFVRVEVTAPQEATPGDHQAAVIVELVDKSQRPSGIAVASRAAALFIITVPGQVQTAGSIDAISASRTVHWSPTVPISVLATNTGNVYMAPQGSVLIRNIFGVVVDEIPVRDWIVLRSSSRTYDMVWEPSFALGRYTAETQLSVFGKKADALAVSFWVLPLLPVLLLLVAILLVSFLVQYLFSRFEVRRK